MTTELLYLLFTAMLTGILWIPVVIGYVLSRGPLKPSDYKVAPAAPLPDWVNRANRAHMNAVENFATFATVVLIAHAVGVSTSITEISAAVYFYARAAHAVVHITGFSLFMARTVLFTVAWVAFVTFAIELLRHTL
ncbi:MAG: MAPEG family protein [Betaproteobacteria bacterium]|nr:MAPEG family protein [Betaproteobacteria bacterium]